jgi:predicted GIY-YIG superfamily endonuclease
MRMARKTVYTKVQVVVYGIISEGKIKYVGSTSRYEERIKEHIKKRPFLDSKDFIILKEIDDDE